MTEPGIAAWQPSEYLKFGKERTRPAVDIVSRIDLPTVRRILDIGCGLGNSTAVLRSRWPNARITGVDSSSEMIQKARADYPQGDWAVADFSSYRPDGWFDLVFSNATLHWIPDHPALIRKMFEMTAKGGAVAAQVPSILDSPLHRAARLTAEEPEWKDILRGAADVLTYHPEAFYYEHLSRHSGQCGHGGDRGRSGRSGDGGRGGGGRDSALSSRVELWHTIYYHVMNTHRDIIEWYSSTGLKPYLSRIPGEAQKQKFKDHVQAACAKDYPVQADGKILFPFKRLFMIAYA